MGNDAVCGLFIILDGESRGTLNDMIHLIMQNKIVLGNFSAKDQHFIVKNLSDLNELIASCMSKTQNMYSKLLQKFTIQKK